VFDESTLVLEGVTLREVVELVVEVLVDLSGGTVLDEETAEDTKTAHPEDLAVNTRISKRSQSSLHIRQFPPNPLSWWCCDCVPGHTSIGGTLPLTETTVAANSSSGGQLPGAGTRVHGDGLADDEAILDELADGLAGVGVGDFADLVGVEPDLALSATDNGGREALLSAEVDPMRRSLSAFDQMCGCGRWEAGAIVPSPSPGLGCLLSITASREECYNCGIARRCGAWSGAVGVLTFSTGGVAVVSIAVVVNEF
jgi:hypothetical protein